MNSGGTGTEARQRLGSRLYVGGRLGIKRRTMGYAAIGMPIFQTKGLSQYGSRCSRSVMRNACKNRYKQAYTSNRRGQILTIDYQVEAQQHNE